jgi:hypothetical protein
MFDCVLQNKERRGSCAILVAARAGVQVNVGNEFSMKLLTLLSRHSLVMWGK